MSFQNLVVFAESMRILGYTRPISVESFNIPNIELVADILHWLIKRYDISADVPFEIETEEERIAFFRKCCEVALLKARVKLDIWKLYRADVQAVEELLKFTKIMLAALRIHDNNNEEYSLIQAKAVEYGRNNSRSIRQLCGTLTDLSASFYNSLENEMKNRDKRIRLMGRSTEISVLEKRLKQILKSTTQKSEELKNDIATLNGDSTNFEQKIENKKLQYDRAKKRLLSLKKVKPAFVEEYETFEGELQQHLLTYLEQYRNLEYLESELNKFNSKEDALLAEQDVKLQAMRDKLRREELQMLGNEYLQKNISDEDIEGDVTLTRFPEEFTRRAEAAADQNRAIENFQHENGRSSEQIVNKQINGSETSKGALNGNESDSSDLSGSSGDTTSATISDTDSISGTDSDSASDI